MMITCSFNEIQLQECPYIYDEESYKVGILFRSLLSFTNENDEISDEFVGEYLGEWEKKYFNSYYRNKKRQYHLLHGRIISKKLIKKYFLSLSEKDTLMYKDIEIKNILTGEQKGKPEITFRGEKQNLNVTIAHCDEFAGALVGEGCIVGMDIEMVKTFDDSFMCMISNLKERNELNEKSLGISIIKKWTLFWTIKEAIGKALGVGFFHGFNSIQVYYTDLTNFITIKFDEKMNEVVKDNIVGIEIYYQFIKNSCCTFCIIKEK
ncbi:4'-phosphopantetheinyl transferase superfamily protein [Clostridium sp. FP2]|uniref:4'-phosphopantetheinyl transferase family protein n=1 Tax=Clostridium sp. FP2 TaxID=2724481 RepID=UPI0013E96947|nr:4'-phosphopantetheinyl transferase superfamily protein [Clostridium sp. FP2]MBZ9625580.1 4'-phosphopantetheinyl transferase superfamily protein [Clostridium sp. FP2]